MCRNAAVNAASAAQQNACGWPKADPPPDTGDYVLKLGGYPGFEFVEDKILRDAGR